MTTAALAVPDLADMPAEPPAIPASYDEWSLGSMQAYLDAQDSWRAWHGAKMAAERQQDGSPHLGVMLALAAAEMAAPDAEKPWHAARLDAYAAAYGLRGWYRYTSRFGGGRPAVQVNKLRGPEDGDRGRYYVQTAIPGRPRVIDRDTGRFAGGDFAGSKAAQAWIDAAESAGQ